MKTKTKQIISDCVKAIIIAVAGAVIALLADSCSAVRTITNSSEYYSKGDTSVVIQTKTIEKYDASKR